MRRADLERLPAETKALRAIRSLRDTDVEDIAEGDLERAQQWLRMAERDCRAGINTIDRILATRRART